MCLAQDTNWIMIQQECTDLVKNETFAFVYCYDDKAKIKNINIYKDALDALPDEGVGYISELKKIPDEGFSFTKIVKNLKTLKTEEEFEVPSFLRQRQSYTSRPRTGTYTTR